MALLIRGKSTCPICGTVIGENDEVIATPAFLRTTHPLAAFSDAAFHRWCFAATPEHVEVERLYSQFKAKLATAPTSLKEYETWIKNAMEDFE